GGGVGCPAGGAARGGPRRAGGVGGVVGGRGRGGGRGGAAPGPGRGRGAGGAPGPGAGGGGGLGGLDVRCE
ncbi:hypothetical protein BV371_29010, partial [Klebsiella pneumoniae]